MKEKLCKKCDLVLSVEMFSKAKQNTDGLLGHCKICQKKERNFYYLCNKEALDNKNKEWKKNNKDKVSIMNKASRSKNPEAWKTWYEKNKEKHVKKNSEYFKNRLINDENFAITIKLRNRINAAFYSRGIRKKTKTTELLGCSIQELKIHIEKKFQEGMKWDNRGEWHIDHIKPCASFDLTKESEQKLCFHFSNLQPLWATDNIKKGSKINV